MSLVGREMPSWLKSKGGLQAAGKAVSPAVSEGGSCTLSWVFGEYVCRHWTVSREVAGAKAAPSSVACFLSMQGGSEPLGSRVAPAGMSRQRVQGGQRQHQAS